MRIIIAILIVGGSNGSPVNIPAGAHEIEDKATVSLHLEVRPIASPEATVVIKPDNVENENVVKDELPLFPTPIDNFIHNAEIIKDEDVEIENKPIHVQPFNNNFCPLIPLKPAEECRGQKSSCWSPGVDDIDCVNYGGLCCFDGCSNNCIDHLEPPPYIPEEEIPPSPVYEVPCQIVNETKYEPKEEEKCEFVTKEVCHDSVQQSCRPVCTTEYETYEGTEQVQECHAVDKEECNDVTVNQCQNEQVPVTNVVTEQVCETKEKEICQTNNVEDCQTQYENQCTIITEVVPETVDVTECQTAYKEECKDNIVHECHDVPTEVQQEQCTSVNNEICQDKIKEICIDVPFEDCRLEFVSKPVKNVEQVCETVSKEECHTVYVEVCTGSRVNSYEPYECKKEPKVECTQVPETICTDKEVVTETLVQEEVCQHGFKKECTNKVEVECIDGPPKEICKNITKLVNQEICTQQNKPICLQVPFQQCFDKQQIIEKEVEKEVCISAPIESCSTKPVETCTNEPYQVCNDIHKPVTNLETQEICRDVVERVCNTVPTIQCEQVSKPTFSQVPKEVCHDVCVSEPVKNCFNETKQQCETVIVQMSYIVPVEVCP